MSASVGWSFTEVTFIFIVITFVSSPLFAVPPLSWRVTVNTTGEPDVNWFAAGV